jgi:predicted aspartyl protease
MKFQYSSIVDKDQDTGDFILLRRPEIPVTLIGPRGQLSAVALVDTGADHTIFPIRFSKLLGIQVSNASNLSAFAFGGQRISLQSGELLLRIEDEFERIEWRTEVSFFDFPSIAAENIVLGHSAFLDYLVATFNGEHSELELSPTSELLSFCAHGRLV